MKKKGYILILIVIAQFFCTSLWFAGNGVMKDLILVFQLKNDASANLTSAVQLGFIIGTLSFALLSIADRFSPSKVFFVCAILAAFFNLGISWQGNSLVSLLLLRFSTGFFLAGIYPVGMKIAADHFDKELGKSLGYLVGALVLGTAFPHFLALFTTSLPWKLVIYVTTILAIIGGLLIFLFVPDGPYRKKSLGFKLSSSIHVFKNWNFRAAAFGYFGHMWELYTFWTFVPLILTTYQKINRNVSYSISLWAFIIIATGSIACIVGGYLSLKWGAKKVATYALAISGICCLLSPISFLLNKSLFIVFLLIWGFTVIMDSPLFSTLVAKNADPKIKGTALTIVNSIGFALTIVSIQTLHLLHTYINFTYLFVILAVGPILGLWALYHKKATH
ncbi:MFS transporter [Tenacibaculum amylolyticum]|uniref:MFS transporter n=1 Tax=Tenacibaculum amylolyticum TaxID=104269 RepID=UPI003893A611